MQRVAARQKRVSVPIAGNEASRRPLERGRVAGCQERAPLPVAGTKGDLPTATRERQFAISHPPHPRPEGGKIA